MKHDFVELQEYAQKHPEANSYYYQKRKLLREEAKKREDTS